jgi:hypothetical protein
MKPSLKMLRALGIFALGCAALWFGITGIIYGLVEYPGRYHHFEVARTASPTAFWTYVAFWLVAGIGFSWRAVVHLRQVLHTA